MRDVLWKDGDDDHQEAISDADEVDVDDKRYGRLKQSSSATYAGRFGPHYVEEPLYRELGMHNGPTVAKHRRSMVPEGEGGSKKRRVAAGEGPKMALAEGAL